MRAGRVTEWSAQLILMWPFGAWVLRPSMVAPPDRDGRPEHFQGEAGGSSGGVKGPGEPVPPQLQRTSASHTNVTRPAFATVMTGHPRGPRTSGEERASEWGGVSAPASVEDPSVPASRHGRPSIETWRIERTRIDPLRRPPKRPGRGGGALISRRSEPQPRPDHIPDRLARLVYITPVIRRRVRGEGRPETAQFCPPMLRDLPAGVTGCVGKRARCWRSGGSMKFVGVVRGMDQGPQHRGPGSSSDDDRASTML